ncbi:flagellar protein FlaF [Roseibacterium elongatum DSM 19469]|uniref:Flagellar protein FlaF n=1 Tax=Roseicyclus elongatus DSM 19469 TaxID=1294273 RepID=W8SMD0_9RHOB|nr:flagellar biosynthesis regulator FlaF [Roseibacterium elongatum]AHM03700.1 flagellar protein FlaF [Roseibacterium elongatum DSM 19469]
MIATSLAQTAYAAASQPVRTDRGTEYAAFQSVTARLSRALQAPTDMPTRAAALHDNRRLWTLLATDLAGAENGLPQQLRAQLFYLAEFSLIQSSQALREAEALRALIDINTAVMRGLSGMAEAA